MDADQHVFLTNKGSNVLRNGKGVLNEYGNFLSDIRFESGRMTKNNYVSRLQEMKAAGREDLKIFYNIFYSKDQN